MSTHDWQPMDTAPRDGYTHVLLCYVRHYPITLSSDWEPSYEVNQGVWDREAKQWRVWYQRCDFEPPEFVFNDGDRVVNWMPLPPKPSDVLTRYWRKRALAAEARIPKEIAP